MYMKKYLAEALGTFVLVLFGTGVAVVSGGDLVATSLAFGLAIVASAYGVASISGCHVNPAVSLAMLIDGRLSVKDFVGYVIGQVAGAFCGTGILYLILNTTSFGTQNLGANSYSAMTLLSAAAVEIILTFVFVYVILTVTKDESKSNIAPLFIGLTLAFVHLLGIRLTGTSVNPARSLAPALFLCGDALKQVWVFIVFPLIGGAFAALTFKCLTPTKKGRK